MCKCMHCLVLITLFSIACAFTSIPAFANTDTPGQQSDCGSLEVILKKLAAEESLGYHATAIDTDGLVYMWYVNRKTDKWAQVVVDDDLNACIKLRGYDWHFALE